MDGRRGSRRVERRIGERVDIAGRRGARRQASSCRARRLPSQPFTLSKPLGLPARPRARWGRRVRRCSTMSSSSGLVDAAPGLNAWPDSGQADHFARPLTPLSCRARSHVSQAGVRSYLTESHPRKVTRRRRISVTRMPLDDISTTPERPRHVLATALNEASFFRRSVTRSETRLPRF
jgi:hypothetical protein